MLCPRNKKLKAAVMQMLTEDHTSSKCVCVKITRSACGVVAAAQTRSQRKRKIDVSQTNMLLNKTSAWAVLCVLSAFPVRSFCGENCRFAPPPVLVCR
jgi:hypothetical protein